MASVADVGRQRIKIHLFHLRAYLTFQVTTQCQSCVVFVPSGKAMYRTLLEGVYVGCSYSLIGKVLNKQKQEKPLEEDGGKAPGVRLSLWSYKSKLLTPKPKA